jgi:hypothetical protein
MLALLFDVQSSTSIFFFRYVMRCKMIFCLILSCVILHNDLFDL